MKSKLTEVSLIDATTIFNELVVLGHSLTSNKAFKSAFIEYGAFEHIDDLENVKIEDFSVEVSSYKFERSINDNYPAPYGALCLTFSTPDLWTLNEGLVLSFTFDESGEAVVVLSSLEEHDCLEDHSQSHFLSLTGNVVTRSDVRSGLYSSLEVVIANICKELCSGQVQSLR